MRLGSRRGDAIIFINYVLPPSPATENDPGPVYARPARTGQRGLRRTRPLATDCPVHVRVRSWSSLVVASAKKIHPGPSPDVVERQRPHRGSLRGVRRGGCRCGSELLYTYD